MTTTTIIQDIRRPDLRTSVLGNPFWLSSGVFDVTEGDAPDDKSVLLFSFPTADQFIFIEQVIMEIITAFTSGTTIDLGLSTLATDAVTTGGVVTDVNQDAFLEAADITATTIGFYHAAAADGNAWLTAKIAAVPTSPYMLTGAATTVPTVTLECYNSGTVAAGKCRVHFLITKFPA
jgi:hypothetical protein